MSNTYVAIDPLAQIFSTRIYLILVEKLHPHQIKVADVQEAMRSMSVEEKRLAVIRAQALIDTGKVVVEAASATH